MSDDVSRRSMLLSLGVLLNTAAALLLAVPIVGYLLSPLRRKGGGSYRSWIALGALSEFPEGETRLATFHNPFVHPGDGQTADIPCWVRRLAGEDFQVFAINCTHLGCPVRWFPQSALFMCPCHGGAYYADGARASGPPPRGLFQYPYKIENDQLMILAGQLPTLAQPLGQHVQMSDRRRVPCA
jgi:menaquinol-cytochrome c reductase iron-sulfur subunit